MAVFSATKVQASLLKKGFTSNNGDHINYYFKYNGKKTAIRTKVSHNGSDIDDNLCSCMAKQTRLTNNQFKDLINCPLTKEEYERILLSNGLIV